MPYLSKLVKRLALTFAVVVSLGACADAATDGVTEPARLLSGADMASVRVGTITVTPTSASVSVGQKQSYTATLLDSKGNVISGRTISWSSTKAEVATVSSDGIATAVAAGSTTIRASSGGRTGSASLTVVTSAPAPVALVTITPGSDTVTTGSTIDYIVVLRDSAGTVLTERSLVWASTAQLIATVTQSGAVSGVSAGTSGIQVTSEGIVGSASVLVVDAPAAPVATVTVSPDSSSLDVGATVGLTATLRDAAGTVLTGRSIVWSSTAQSVATVNQSGVVSGIAAGTASIRATSEGIFGSAAVTVTSSSSGPNIFEADWSTATGNGSTAITDGGKWTVRAGNVPSPIFTVVAGSTVGWTRTPNVGRVQQLGESAIQLERQNAVPQSTTHWGRFYFRNDETSTWHQHPTAYNTVGDIQSVPFTRAGHSNGWEIGVQLMGHGYPYQSWSPVNRLANGTWYRYEWMVEYVTATTYRFWPRVYNMAGQQILGPDDFKRADFTGTGHSLQTFQAAGNVFTMSSASLARHFGLGNEGPYGAQNTLGYYYFADVALSTSGWIGQ